MSTLRENTLNLEHAGFEYPEVEHAEVGHTEGEHVEFEHATPRLSTLRANKLGLTLTLRMKTLRLNSQLCVPLHNLLNLSLIPLTFVVNAKG